MFKTIVNFVKGFFGGEGGTTLDKAIAAFLGATGIQLDWGSFIGFVQSQGFLSAAKLLLSGGGVSPFLYALVPAILTWFATNKPKVRLPTSGQTGGLPRAA